MKRYIPQEWPAEALAKQLLLLGVEKMRLCINCSNLVKLPSSCHCDANGINMDEYNIEACICENWREGSTLGISTRGYGNIC